MDLLREKAKQNYYRGFRAALILVTLPIVIAWSLQSIYIIKHLAN